MHGDRRRPGHEGHHHCAGLRRPLPGQPAAGAVNDWPWRRSFRDDPVVSDYTVRTLRPDEHRRANALFRSALHVGPATDEQWRYVERAYQPGRVLGAFDTELIGTARFIDEELTVPGGKRLPLA